MNNTNYNYANLFINFREVEKICREQYGIDSIECTELPGEVDFNYKIKTKENLIFILKISRPDINLDYLDFQQKLLLHIEKKNRIDKQEIKINYPSFIKTSDGNTICEIVDSYNQSRKIRLIKWIEGRLLSEVNPQLDSLRYQLGQTCGKITHILSDFNHSSAERKHDWDIAQVIWTIKYLHLFKNNKEKECIEYFLNKFSCLNEKYKCLRKSIIHNDANDNNIIVTRDYLNPKIEALIDYGDAIYSQSINDLACVIAYAVMNMPDPLSASLPIVQGYNEFFPLEDVELQCLYTLIAARLVISIVKSAINKFKEPDNKYLFISEKPAWQLILKWRCISEELCYYSFRYICNYDPLPNESIFKNWASELNIDLNHLIPSLENCYNLSSIDLSIGSIYMGNFNDCQDNYKISKNIINYMIENNSQVLIGGYLEAQPFYSKKIEGNNGPEYEVISLGVNIWVNKVFDIFSVMEGEVISIHKKLHGVNYINYQSSIVIKHSFTIKNENLEFYFVYGNLNEETLENFKIGDKIMKNQKIGTLLQSYPFNLSNLFFQVSLDISVSSDTIVPHLCSINNKQIFSSIFPNPKLIFKEIPSQKIRITKDEILKYRINNLGRNLSLSYKEPLLIKRGNMQYLIDENGRFFLDTVNNVAHVGHENPSVVKIGQSQMAVLNTNTRYLHENVTNLANELKSLLPSELSVVYFTNSGSESNELALRMAYTVTNQRDIIAVELGYHGNTNACIDVSSYKFNGKGGKGCPQFTHIVPIPDCYRGLYSGEECGVKFAQHINETIDKIKSLGGGRNVSAFIIESIISCGGQINLPPGYLKTALEFIRKENALIISDEVQTGFGRVGKYFWGFQLHDIIPDIVTLGKPFGNGHPLGAVVCTRNVADAFNNGMEYFNTFAGNPVSCAIGLEVLKVVKTEKLQENALIIGDYLKNQLESLKNTFPLIGDVRGEGLFLGIELSENNKIPATSKAKYLADRMKDHLILISLDGPFNNVVKIKPPLCFNIDNAKEFIFYFKKILNEDFMIN